MGEGLWMWEGDVVVKCTWLLFLYCLVSVGILVCVCVCLQDVKPWQYGAESFRKLLFAV